MFRQLVAVHPDWEEAWRNLGLSLLKLDRRAEALEVYRDAYANTSVPLFGVRHAQLVRGAGRLEEAAAILEKLRAAHRFEPECRIELGSVFMQQGRLPAALEILGEAIGIAPGNATAQATMGMVHQANKDYDAAASCFRAALAAEPGNPQAMANLGAALAEGGRQLEALPLLEQAVRAQPDLHGAHNNLGNALRASGRAREAIAAFERAIALKPDNPDYLSNLAIAQDQSRDWDRALETCDRALALNPQHAGAHLHRAMIWLVLGQLERGFEEYEWRWKSGAIEVRDFTQPVWDGSDLAGRTILLHAEQGLGDVIQFVRYAPMVKARGGRVVVQCGQSLVRLVQTCPGVDQVVPAGGDLPAFDTHAALMSLPRIFGTSLDTIPAEVPYFRAETAAVEGGMFKVGIAWQGNPRNKRDRLRSIPLACFAALARVPGVQLYSLQKGPGLDQIATAGVPLVNLDAQVNDFADLATFVRAMDLVVSADTACAHLAGALGKRVWLLPAADSEWRWLVDREDSPWYPSMRIFRQATLLDWQPVLDEVARTLAAERGVELERAPEVLKSTVIAPGPPAPLLSSGSTHVKKCRHGFLAYLVTDQYVGRSIDRYGEYSEAEVGLFAQIVQPGATVLEVGANLGAHTVPLARMVGPRGRVFAFEPQRMVFQILCANAALNALSQVFAQQVAVGADAGSVLIPPLDAGVVQNFGSLGHTAWGKGDRVPRITIDGMELDACQFIKIDVEGMEGAVLQGAEGTIMKYRPAMYIENDREEQSPALITRLKKLGYRMYWHTPPLYNPANFYGERENVFPTIVSINLLCLPVETPQNITGLREVTGPQDSWRG